MDGSVTSYSEEDRVEQVWARSAQSEMLLDSQVEGRAAVGFIRL